MKKIIVDFWKFSKNPKDSPYSGNNKNYKWNAFFTLLLCEIILMFFYMPLASLIEKKIDVESKLDFQFNIIFAFFIYIVFIPFLEELIFRYFLRRKGFIALIFKERIWNRLYPILFYTSVLLFGLVHITNYEFNSIWIFVLTPLLVFTQIIGGLVMSYLRVRFNFWMGFLYHATWNFLAVFILGTIFFHLEKHEVNLTTETYSLNIEEFQFVPIMESKIISFSATNDSVYEIESLGYSADKLLKIVFPEQEVKADAESILNFKFKSDKGISTDSLLHILTNEGYIKKKTQAY